MQRAGLRVSCVAFCHRGTRGRRLYFNPLSTCPVAKNSNIVFVLPLNLFLILRLVCHEHNPGLTKHALFRGKRSKQKVVSPLWQSKQCYQRSTYSHPETERRRMPHWLILPARPVALISWRKDQCRWWTPHSPQLPPHSLPSSLYICLNTWGILKGGELKRAACVCVLSRCCRATLSHAGAVAGGAEKTEPSPARLLEC